MASLSSYVVEADDATAAAQFILLCKRGDANAAAAFLRRTLAEVDGSALDMSTLSSTLGYDLIGTDPRPPVTSDASGGLQPMNFVGDELDKQTATLVMLIPGDMHVVGHLIGKGGLEIGKIESESGASIKIEAHSHILSNVPQPVAQILPSPNSLTGAVANGQQNERIVSITGTVVACVKAQRLLDRRLRARLESDGIHREVLRIIVPNDFVRHLIGKGGTNISQLQTQTGIRIQVQTEANMAPNQLGRVVTFQGAEFGRANAQYFVSRQIAEGPFRDWPQQHHQQQVQQSQQQPLSPSAFSSTWAMLGSGSTAPDWSFMEPPKHSPKEHARDHRSGAASPTMSPGSAFKQPPGMIMASNLSLSPASIPPEAAGSPHSFGHEHNNRMYLGEGHGVEEDVEQSPHVIQLSVPNVAVAFLIGRGGSTVGEMEQKSGARIHFSKQNAGEINRLVEIRGSPTAVRNAQSLVQARIDAYLSSHGQHQI